MKNNVSDYFLINENRKYLDSYYSNGIPSDNISKLRKSIRVLQTFGIAGVLKILKKGKSKNYISDTKEENCTEVKYKKRVAIYTAIIGGYDKLQEPKYVSPFCDYYVFTDGEVSNESIWKKKKMVLSEEFKILGNYQKAKFLKVFPHILFPEYEYSIWLDGNIEIYGELIVFIDRMNNRFLAGFEHPSNDCIYDEAITIVSQGKAEGREVIRQIKGYKKQGFPEHYGLLENSFIIRKHNDKTCVNLMELWWEQMKEYTWRDQLSLTYSMWKCGIKLEDVTILGPCWRWNPRLRQYDHMR